MTAFLGVKIPWLFVPCEAFYICWHRHFLLVGRTDSGFTSGSGLTHTHRKYVEKKNPQDEKNPVLWLYLLHALSSGDKLASEAAPSLVIDCVHAGKPRAPLTVVTSPVVTKLTLTRCRAAFFTAKRVSNEWQLTANWLGVLLHTERAHRITPPRCSSCWFQFSANSLL